MGGGHERRRRHLRWVIPLAAAPIVYFGATWGVWVVSESSRQHKENVGLALAVLVFAMLASIGPLVALIFAVIGEAKAFRFWRRSQGHYTRSEAILVEGQRQSAAAWDRACSLRNQLCARHIPNQVRIWDVVPHAGEAFFYDVQVGYARYYGQDVSYSQSTGFYFGRPAFVLAGIGVTALTNASRRHAAEAQARTQWREYQPCRLVVTNQRLLCQVGGQWLSTLRAHDAG